VLAGAPRASDEAFAASDRATGATARTANKPARARRTERTRYHARVSEPLAPEFERRLHQAERTSAAWEAFSALLFASAVLPAVLGTPWPGVLFAVGLLASRLFARPLAARGREGVLVASGLRVLAWPLALVGLEPVGGPKAWVATLAFGLMAGAMRRAIYGRRIEPAPAWASDDAQGLGRWIRRRFAESAVLAGIVGGHLLLLFGVAFLHAESRVIFEGWWSFVPILGASATGAYTLLVARLTRGVTTALRAGPEPSSSMARARADLRRLPNALARVNFVLWTVCATVGVFYFRTGPAFGGVAAAMQIAVVLLFALGVAYYQRGWDLASVRDAERQLGASVVAPVGDEPPRPLRSRMLREFGGPLAFGAALMMLSSLALYRSLSEAGRLSAQGGEIVALVAAFVLLTLAIGVVLARVAADLSRPLTDVAQAAERAAAGRLDVPVPSVDGPREIVGLAASVERMREGLSRTIAELELERAGLESKVEARTRELTVALTELREAQAALVQGERLASIGELVANVAHEIRNPLNAVAGSAEPLGALVSDLRAVIEAYREAEAELPPARREALAALRGRIDLDASLDDLEGISRVIRRASERTVRIVQALSGFARTSVEAVPSNLDVALDETLALLGGRLRQAAIEVERLGDPLPLVTCRAHEISQVFLNVIVNAIDAIEGVGATVASEARSARPRRIVVRTERVEGEVVLAFSDTGPGLSAALADRAFEPFVTTKPAGQGTGLGLSISRDLARRHGGRLEVERDVPLGGARFVLRLPIAGPRRAGSSASA